MACKVNPSVSRVWAVSNIADNINKTIPSVSTAATLVIFYSKKKGEREKQKQRWVRE